MSIRPNVNYRISFLFFFALAILFWLLSGNALHGLERQPPITTFQNVGELHAADYEPMRRSEAQAKTPLPFTLWSQLDNQRLEGSATNRNQTVSWLAVRGDTRLVLPVFQNLDEQDTDGCLIDKATAEKLFANSNAVGGIVKLRGKEYPVRGVIDGPSRTILTQLSNTSTQALTNISVAGTEYTDTFLMRHSLSAALTVKSDLYTTLAELMCQLPIFAAALVVLRLLLLLRAKWKPYMVRYILVTLCIFALGTATLLYLFSLVPEQIIPSQWSDFEFWKTAGAQWKALASDFFTSAKYRPDLLRLYSVLQAALGILSAHFIFSLYRLYRIHNGNRKLLALQHNIQINNIIPAGANSWVSDVRIGWNPVEKITSSNLTLQADHDC